MSGFLTIRTLVTREDAAGAIQSNPICIEYPSESFDLKEEQASEVVNLLGSGGDASPDAFGTSTFSGSVGHVVTIDNAPIILTHALGAALTSAAATAEVWTADTTYAVGDTVNTTVDTKHSLTCTAITGTAKSHAATEPTLEADPNDDRNAKVTDNEVTWVALPKLITDTYELTQIMPTFTIEYELEDPSANKFYKRFSGVRMNSLPVAMSGGTISLKASIDFLGVSALDSEDTDWVEPLADITGARIVPTFKDYYSYEECTVKVDTVALCETDSVSLDTNRNVTIEDAVNNCKISNVGIPTISGTMSRVFETADFNNAKTHTDFELLFDFVKLNGCALALTYPLVKPKLADPIQSIDKQTMMSVDISAYGVSGTKSVQASVTYPGLYDSTGTLVGAY